MFALHYDKIKQKHGGKAELLMTDTDSLSSISKPKMYVKTCYKNGTLTTSANICHHTNCLVLKINAYWGKMKDEFEGNMIKEFISLRPKMYSILEADGYKKKTAKGVAKKT